MPGDPDGSPYICLMAALISLLFGAVYSSCSAYLHHVNENRLRREGDSGSGTAMILLKLLQCRGEIVCRLPVMFWGMCLAGSLSALMLPKIRELLPFSSFWDGAVGYAAALVLSALIFLIFADVIPRKLTAHRAPRYTFKRAGLIRFFYLCALPLYSLVRLSSDLFVRLFGVDPRSVDDTVTEEEIILMVGEGEEKGIIEEVEKDMIENILDFNDTLVSEIMTHRTDMCAVEDDTSIEQALFMAVEEGRSRVPVFHEDIDSIRGILYVKDLLPYIGKPIPDNISLTDMMRPAYFVPESKKCSQLFSELTEKRIHIAVIVDEYGGTCGLVTIEDLIESIVGSIQDEYDNEEEEIQKHSETEFTVDGTTPIDEINDLTDTELPEGEYDTIAGFVTERLGRILREGDHPSIVERGLEISVLEVEDQRISKLKICKLPLEEKPGKASKSEKAEPGSSTEPSPLHAQ